MPRGVVMARSRSAKRCVTRSMWQLRHHDEELIAAPAEEEIVGADAGADGVGDGADRFVAGGVAFVRR